MYINYEDEFEDALKKNIRDNFSLKEKDSEVIYMISRYLLVKEKEYIKDIDEDSFILFLLKENNIKEPIIYKNERIFLKNNICSIKNIVSNWFLGLELLSYKNVFIIPYIEKLVKITRETSIKKNFKYKNTPLYKISIIYTSLLLLNEEFKVELNGYRKLDNVYYDDNYNDFERYLEEKLIVQIDIDKKEINKITISEKKVEDYLKKHLYLIEEGLTLIKTQFKIENGSIDILARDKNNVDVIIELKIKNDERIIYQSVYYPLQYKKEYHKNHVRFIFIGNGTKDYLYETIKDLDKNIECFSYNIELNGNEIKKITISKLSI